MKDSEEKDLEKNKDDIVYADLDKTALSDGMYLEIIFKKYFFQKLAENCLFFIYKYSRVI